MQEAGIPVTYGYISDLHEQKADTRVGCTTTANSATAASPSVPATRATSRTRSITTRRSRSSSSGSQADGITPANTLFVISAEENDQFAGANVGRRDPADAGRLRRSQARRATTRPERSASCRRTSRRCSRAVRARARSSTSSRRARRSTCMATRPADDPAVRQLERDTAAMTSPHDPYSGRQQREDRRLPGGRARAARAAHADGRPAAYADVHALPEAGLLLLDLGTRRSASSATSPTTTATTARTSTSPGSASPARVSQVNGVDGPQPDQGNQPSDPNRRTPSRRRARSGRGSRRPTSGRRCCTCSASRDDYQSDGHVDHAGASSRCRRRSLRPRELAAGYDQINSSVGQFGRTRSSPTRKRWRQVRARTTAPTRRSSRRS